MRNGLADREERSITAFPEVKSLRIEKILFGVRAAFPKYRLLDMHIEQFEDFATDAMVYELRGFLYGAKRTETRKQKDCIRFPETWWQMFKERFFPRWLVKHFPIRETKHTFVVSTTYNETKICPHLDIQDHGKEYEHIAWLDSPLLVPPKEAVL